MISIAKMGAILAFMGVALGAFGAHALKSRLSFGSMQIWNTAVLYQMIHAVALFALGLSAKGLSYEAKITGWLFIAGMMLFSGSLYALALSGIKPLGAVTPLGGLCFLAGWAWWIMRG